MEIEWLGHADIETYYTSKYSLLELLPNIVEENHKAHVRAMVRDCEYIIEWLETGRRPGNKRGVERLAAYQREIPSELMERYANPPKPVEFHDDNKYYHLEYVLTLLTERERECYEMRIGGMWNEHDIARNLGITRGAVQTFIRRAEAKVKKHKNKPIPLSLVI
ncbi:sigma factor-like helix-turn-helix DNA-binding protein [Paenibacillus qinlingensis]|uniref:RNA polymerase sigma-70 factor (ECF subfamily) n=1 Tax=Paenibacillus qinlingensis TaxID=1837343 RepID=A0ABU1P6R6_9BACL|nr:sigma factor-like helix-turn-helix DNA-binding protein [Paenibacillus qinlingensis]MDR6555453.1 RNA polymerase sigma-70 factor (ECF subfamily) [Paenibacillus qinlingensis]